MIKTSHFGIYGIICKNGMLALIKKARGPYAGYLDLPGGKPEYGETPLETLAREIAEETGIWVKKAQLLDAMSTVVTYCEYGLEKQVHHTAILYYVTEYDDTVMIPVMESEDSLGAAYYALKELEYYTLSPFAQKIKLLLNQSNLAS